MTPWRVQRQIYNYSRQQSYQRIRWNICRWIPRISLTIGLRKPGRSDNRPFIITSRKKSSAHPEKLTVLAIAISLSGFVVLFLGLRGLHWSVTMAQLGATAIMAVFRALVRSNMVHKPNYIKINDGYELEWMSKDMKECETWHIVAREFGNPISLGSLAMEVVTARRRLDTLCRPKWSRRWQEVADSVADSLEASMNFVFSSPDVILTDKQEWLSQGQFEWKLVVQVKIAGSGWFEKISLRLERHKLDSGQ